jgi:hypothetical protein
MNVSDMRGNCLWISLYYDSIQSFYTMLWVPYKSVLFAYLQREWEDRHMKIKKRGIRGSKNKGNEENGYPLGTHAGPSLLSRVDPLCVMSFMLVFFSWMPIWSRSCCSARLSLFSLHRSRLGLFFFELPPFPPASPTRSVSIQILITDCGNSANG